MAGKIIADTIEAQGSFISLNVAGQTVLTANSSGLAYLPTGNVTINVVSGATQFANLGITALTTSGIKFPATQVASSDVNTLDDYEEGTFTPTLRFGGNTVGITYDGTNGCQYVKIGKVVTVNGILYLSSKGSSTGAMTIAGLPFTSSGTPQGYFGFQPHIESITIPSGYNFIFIAGYPSSTTLNVFLYKADGNYISVDNTHAGNATQFRFSFSYIASA